MRYISYTGNDPYIVASMLEACATDTVALVNCSVDWIYLGYIGSKTSYINPNTALPIVRCCGLGGAYVAEGGGKNLLFCMNTSSRTQIQAGLEIIRDVAIARGMTGVYIQSNDVMYGTKQIGMVSPFIELDNGRFVTLLQITLSVDLNKVEANLLFPDGKWGDKPNITSIRDWLMGIREVNPNVTVTQIVNSLRATIQSKYGITVTTGSWTTAETTAANLLKTTKYTLPSYINYGEW
jgi:lipoate-protein ligase A